MLLVTEVERLVDNIEFNFWKKRNVKERLRLLLFDYGFMTQENADTFPLLICRDSRNCQTGATCVEQKDLVFRRTILNCDTEPSTQSLQDAVIQACAGVESDPTRTT